MPAPLEFDDGLLRFTLNNRETGEATKHTLDVLLLRLTCEEAETLHNLPLNDSGAYKPTAAFLADLAKRIEELGVPGCTASVAYQLWVASATEIESLKKNTSETPNLHSGSESNQESQSNESAASDSPPPETTPANVSDS
ncbi:MAG: hypothetical protein ACREUY_04480 [Burkholderiales bacterium]